VVVSPGSRNVPFVHSIEQDDFFQCYSVVDERSAAFFASGIAIDKQIPVVFTCTSSTASANYLPAMINANKHGIPIIALTFDRDYRKLGKMEDQMINQEDMYGKYAALSVNIPLIRDEKDVWYETSELNTIFTKVLDESVPVQINVQIDDFGAFNCPELPKARKVESYDLNRFNNRIKVFQEELHNKKRILVYCGQTMEVDPHMISILEMFQTKYNAVVSYDEFSCAKSDQLIKTVLVTESMHLEEFERYCPDLVITFGGHSWSFMKYKLRYLYNNFHHWHLSEAGELKDSFNALTRVFKIPYNIFFTKMVETDYASDGVYLKLWRERLSMVRFPDLGYSNFGVISKVVELLPENSLIHLSILNSIRIVNFLGTPKNCRVFANLGTDGIDGCLSTFIGQSREESSFSLLVIGDLSSIYDMSAFQYLDNSNQHILILNNYVGSEFYNNFGSYINTVDDYIGARHNSTLKAVCDYSDVEYLSCSNVDELNSCLHKFFMPHSKPVILEAFTDPSMDTKVLGNYYSMNLNTNLKIKLKKVLKKLRFI
jgi:2-succinyl-5-enolpyruvyl-6-hydroxy-3-cyclohexene-1-carboxylate synthase